MSEKTDTQLTFNFPAEKPAAAHKASATKTDVNMAHQPVSAPAIYSLASQRAKVVARDSATHFSAILNLVTHIK